MSDYLDDVGNYAQLVVDLQKLVKKQQAEIKDLKGIIDVQNAMKIPITIVQQVAGLETKIDKLNNDLKYYKRFATQQQIEEWEDKKKPTRGSLSSTLKNTK